MKPCGLCGAAKVFRRDLCRSCYRKLDEQGLPMPPPSQPGPEGGSLYEWLSRWSPEDLRRLLRDLMRVLKDRLA